MAVYVTRAFCVHEVYFSRVGEMARETETQGERSKGGREGKKERRKDS